MPSFFFFWVRLCSLSFLRICPFQLSFWIYGIMLFIIFPYYPFDMCRHCNDVSLSFLTLVICGLSLFVLINWPWFSNFIDFFFFFPKNQLLVSLIFLYYFSVFYFIDFCSSLTLLMFTLGIIRSYFSNFLRERLRSLVLDLPSLLKIAFG